jgi:hypothetical protein
MSRLRHGGRRALPAEHRWVTHRAGERVHSAPRRCRPPTRDSAGPQCPAPPPPPATRRRVASPHLVFSSRRSSLNRPRSSLYSEPRFTVSQPTPLGLIPRELPSCRGVRFCTTAAVYELYYRPPPCQAPTLQIPRRSSTGGKRISGSAMQWHYRGTVVYPPEGKAAATERESGGACGSG